MDSIDLRSDTVTWPTSEMREAMASAEVGDDVWGDDPTALRLEALAAERTGKESALFVTSGTQGNLIAILTHCKPGDEMITGRRAHTFIHEVGGAAALGGVHPCTVPVQSDGTLDLDDIRGAIRDINDLHNPITRLVEIENPQGDLGSLPLSPDYMRSLRALCDEYGLSIHMDGARVFNAAAALGCDVKDLTDPVDSVMFCLSKGLCAPIGSMLCGSAEFIQRARRLRKMLGGGMRQVGVIAAAGIIAIEKMSAPERLSEDHMNARQLADGLAGIEGIQIDLPVETNMVFFSLDEAIPFDASGLYDRLEKDYNIKLCIVGERRFRAVTHYWIKAEDIVTVVEAIRELCSAR